MKLIFLLEEPSMKYLLDGILPKILPDGVTFQTIPHSGKRDLEISIPRKLRGWNEPEDIRFIILHDQDTKDCVALKNQLLHICLYETGTGTRISPSSSNWHWAAVRSVISSRMLRASSGGRRSVIVTCSA